MAGDYETATDFIEHDFAYETVSLFFRSLGIACPYMYSYLRILCSPRDVYDIMLEDNNVTKFESYAFYELYKRLLTGFRNKPISNYELDRQRVRDGKSSEYYAW